jgi:TRAP-type C4-dicarboxylate transport system permease small subunit
MKTLEVLARFCAILAGLLLTGITLLTCASVAGREIFGKPLVGDFELAGVMAGAAIALFMPWCQAQRGNIIVDFFTSKVSGATNARLDRLGALLVCGVMLMLAWRTTVGAVNAYSTQSGSMILGFPEWITYSLMVPPFVLTALISLVQSARTLKANQ